MTTKTHPAGQIRINRKRSNGKSTVIISVDAVSSMTPVPKLAYDHGELAPAWRKSGVPYVIPSAQIYYWSARWQDDEAENLRDIEAGRVRRFTDRSELMRYLRDGDPDEA